LFFIGDILKKEVVIQINNLSYLYNNKPVLDKVSCSINQGDFVTILGSNGVGKTTLLKCIARQHAVKENSIFIRQKDICKYRQKEYAGIVGYLPQKTSFNLPYTVKELLKLSGYPYSKEGINEDMLTQAIEMFKLEHLQDRRINSLSGGECQKLMLASVFVQNTDIICLDEPFSFLDPTQCESILNILEDLFYKRNKTIIIVLHNLNNIYFSNIYKDAKAILLKNREIFFNGQLAEAVKSFEEFYSRSFTTFSKDDMEFKF